MLIQPLILQINFYIKKLLYITIQNMDKPIIRFYEPFEIIVLANNEIMSYLDEPQITENQMLYI